MLSKPVQNSTNIFDTVILQILHADATGHVCLQAARDIRKTQLVRNRIRNYVSSRLCFQKVKNEDHTDYNDDGMIPCEAAQEILSRVHFIPRVKSDVMNQILLGASVILHPFPFGGSKTASDALALGVPLVTYPQKYLRGKCYS